MKLEHPDSKIMAKYSSVPVYKSMINSDDWKLVKVTRKMNKEIPGGLMDRKTGFRDKGVTSFSFEYINKPEITMSRETV